MPNKDDVMRAICCPRGCQMSHSEATCYTCRSNHEAQAEAVLRLFAGFVPDPRKDPARATTGGGA